MVFPDVFTRVSNAQDLAEIGTTVVSTNSIPLSDSASYLRDIGGGGHVRMRFYCNTAITGMTSVAFEVILASDSALTSNLLLLQSSGAVVAADTTAGAWFDVAIPDVSKTLGDAALRRFLGARYTIVGTVSAGSVTASIVNASVTGGHRKFVTGYTGP